MRFDFKSLCAKILPLILCLLLVFSLSACRESSALEQLLYSQNSDQLADANVQSMDNQEDNENKIDNISPLQKQEDADEQREQKRDTPVWGNNPNDERETDKVEFDINALGDAETQGAATIELKPNDYTNKETDENLISEIDKGASITQEQNTKQIVDAYGNIIELPSNIQRITAVGEAANLVYMLGGGDRLIATSESFHMNKLAVQVFGEKQMSYSQALWADDGTEPLDMETFVDLLAMGPDVCIELSGSKTFTAEQISMLNAAEISYVVLPPLNTTENISTAITVLADILGNEFDNNDFDAPALAAFYKEFSTELLTDMADRVDRFVYNSIDFNNDKYKYGVKNMSDDFENSENGKYTVFIHDWEEDTEYRLYSAERVTLRGDGAALCRSGYSNSPLSYYMSLAGVVNSSAIFQDFNIESEWYVSPLQPSSRILAYNGGRGTTQLTGGNMTAVPAGASTNSATVSRKYINLGSELFPAIVVPSQYVKERIEADPMWDFYDVVTAKSGMQSDYGFLDEEGNIIKSNVVGEYEIFVNPYGIGSWTDGSAESILEAVWIAWKFHNAYTEEEFLNIVKDFYLNFYHYALTDNDIQLLLNGKIDSVQS